MPTANKNSSILFMVVRMLLMLVLLLPVAPAFSSITNSAISNTESKHCLDKIETSHTISSAQLIAVDTAMKDHQNCNNSCCTNGNCVCQGPCQQFSSSHSTFIYSLNNNLSLPGDRAHLKPVYEIHLLSNLNLPALRPPINWVIPNTTDVSDYAFV